MQALTYLSECIEQKKIKNEQSLEPYWSY